MIMIGLLSLWIHSRVRFARVMSKIFLEFNSQGWLRIP